jgi:hypothetical protein
MNASSTDMSMDLRQLDAWVSSHRTHPARAEHDTHRLARKTLIVTSDTR